MDDNPLQRISWTYGQPYVRYRRIADIVTGLWALQMFWHGARMHIPHQPAWETAGYAANNASFAWLMLWMLARFVWLCVALTALADYPTIQQPFLGRKVATLLTVILGTSAIVMCVFIASVGYRAPTHA